MAFAFNQLVARKAAGPIEVVQTRRRGEGLRSSSGRHSKRGVETARHPAESQSSRRNAQRGHLSEMAQRQRDLLCCGLQRSVRLGRGRRSDLGAPRFLVVPGTSVVGRTVDALRGEVPASSHPTPRSRRRFVTRPSSSPCHRQVMSCACVGRAFSVSLEWLRASSQRRMVDGRR